MNAGVGQKAWTPAGRPPTPVSAQPTEAGAAFAAQFVEVTRQLLPLPAWLARYPLSLTSPSSRQALWARGRRITANEDIGFAIAERVDIEASTGPIWRLYQTAPSLRALYESYVQWKSLFFDFMEGSYTERGDQVCMSATAPAGIVVDRGEQDCRLVLALKTWRAVRRGAPVDLLSASFSYARPASVRRHQSALGTHALSFSQPSCQLVISRQLFDAPLPGADRDEFARLHAAACEAARSQEARSVTTMADETVTWLLAAPGATVQAVARQLGMSARTLRRRLAEEGSTFRALIDSARQREVQLFLETGLYTMKQLASRVGFANDRALRHALRRWQTRKTAR
jgi:AraC-like DNA-binding protein